MCVLINTRRYRIEVFQKVSNRINTLDIKGLQNPTCEVQFS